MNKNLESRRALVIGLGKSGRAGAQALKKLGAAVDVYDGKEDSEKRVWAQELGVGVSFGESPAQIKGYDLVVMSPGISADKDFIREAEADGAEVIGELELAYRYGKGNYIAITGTNGKTTTTALTGEIFKAAGKRTEVVGNIGVAVVSKAVDADDGTWFITECSSFQLETAKAFRPVVSAILNITPDHLDRHKTMENYSLAKARIFANQLTDEYFIYNEDDELTKKMSQLCKAVLVPFSRKKELEFGAFVKEGEIIIRDKNKEHIICKVSELKMPGIHNLENALAAAAISHFAGIGSEYIRDTLRTFAGVAHRLEDCGKKNGVRYINDSKGTNPDASVKAVQSFENIILIAGGYDKGASYDEFVNAFAGHVKTLVLMGATAEKIREAAESSGFSDIHMANNMKEAVTTAAGLAKSGDTVLLSPACASWDMYAKFEDRGDDFKKCVNELD